jgi:hypothetical protein
MKEITFRKWNKHPMWVEDGNTVLIEFPRALEKSDITMADFIFMKIFNILNRSSYSTSVCLAWSSQAIGCTKMSLVRLT